MNGNMARLPQWAQARIGEAEAEVKRLKALLDERQLPVADRYPIFARTSVIPEQEIYLPKRTYDLTYKSNGFEMTIKPSERTGGGGMGPIKDGVQIMCQSWHGLAIRPEASNVLTIFPGRDR